MKKNIKENKNNNFIISVYTREDLKWDKIFLYNNDIKTTEVIIKVSKKKVSKKSVVLDDTTKS